MKSRYLIALLMIACIPFIYGFTSGYIKTDKAAPEITNNVTVTGEQLFQKM